MWLTSCLLATFKRSHQDIRENFMTRSWDGSSITPYACLRVACGHSAQFLGRMTQGHLSAYYGAILLQERREWVSSRCGSPARSKVSRGRKGSTKSNYIRRTPQLHSTLHTNLHALLDVPCSDCSSNLDNGHGQFPVR